MDISTLLTVMGVGIPLLKKGINTIKDKENIGKRAGVTTKNGGYIEGKVINIDSLKNIIVLETDWGDKHHIKEDDISDTKIFSDKRVRVINKMNCDMGFAIASNSKEKMCPDDISALIDKIINRYCSSNFRPELVAGEIRYNFSRSTLRGFTLYIGKLKPEDMQCKNGYEVSEDKIQSILPDMKCFGEKREINTQEFFVVFEDLCTLQIELGDVLKKHDYSPTFNFAAIMKANIPGYYKFFNDIARSMSQTTTQETYQTYIGLRSGITLFLDGENISIFGESEAVKKLIEEVTGRWES